MGFFDKLFGKGKKDKDNIEEISDHKEVKEAAGEETAADDKNDALTSEQKKAENTESGVNDGKTDADKVKTQSEKVTAAFEMFPVKKDSVSAERNNAICVKFINEALAMGQELKEDDLQGLTYEELCMLYNHMQIMSFKLEPKIKAIAGVVIENNIKVTRVTVLKMLKKRTLYTLYTKISHLPFANNGALYLFTQKESAEKQVMESDLKYLLLKEIPKEQLEAHLDVFYMTGYKEIIVDMGTKIPFGDLYSPKDASAYGIINPVLCGKMVFFGQMTAAFSDKAKAEARGITDEENKQINRVWTDITEGLIRSTLLLPAEAAEDGKIKLKGVSVKAPDGKNWLAMFTDQVALNTFFKANQTSAGIKNPILSQYAAIKDKAEIEGIIINPARESFRIPSKVLATRQEYKKPDGTDDSDNKTE